MRQERRSLAAGLALLGLLALAAPALAADEAAAAPPARALTTADLKGIATPSSDDLAKGDPGGTLTGSTADIVMADPKAGLTLADVVNQVGQNRIAINFVWTLVAGFLVMFMQAGFALQQGGSAGISNLGGMNPLNNEFKLSLFGKDWGLFGTKGFFLSGESYDVGVMVLFLFQMVFMDTALTIVTGAAAERW